MTLSMMATPEKISHRVISAFSLASRPFSSSMVSSMVLSLAGTGYSGHARLRCECASRTGVVKGAVEAVGLARMAYGTTMQYQPVRCRSVHFGREAGGDLLVRWLWGRGSRSPSPNASAAARSHGITCVSTGNPGTRQKHCQAPRFAVLRPTRADLSKHPWFAALPSNRSHNAQESPMMFFAFV